MDDRTIKLNSMDFTTVSMSDNEIKKFRFLTHEFNDLLINDDIKINDKINVSVLDSRIKYKAKQIQVVAKIV